MRRPSGHRQVTKTPPDLIPIHLAIPPIHQPRRPHRLWLHVLIAILILLRENSLKPNLQRLQLALRLQTGLHLVLLPLA